MAATPLSAGGVAIVRYNAGASIDGADLATEDTRRFVLLKPVVASTTKLTDRGGTATAFQHGCRRRRPVHGFVEATEGCRGATSVSGSPRIQTRQTA